MKNDSTVIGLLVIGALAYWAYSSGMLGGATAINPSGQVILQTAPGQYTGTVAYSSIPGAPSPGATFSLSGQMYQLSVGTGGQLYGTLIG